MWYRYLFVLLLIGACTSIAPPPAKAVSGCEVSTSAATYANGFFMGAFNCDTSGNVRMSLGTLLSGEDQTNNLLMTSGGAVRGAEGNIINSAVGDATSSAFTLPTGPKTITGRITGAGAVVQTIKIHGGTNSSFTVLADNLLCTLTLSGTSGAAGTEGICPPITAAILYYKVVTSASSGTPTTILTASY